MLESGDWNHLKLGTCGIYVTHCWHRTKRDLHSRLWWISPRELCPTLLILRASGWLSYLLWNRFTPVRIWYLSTPISIYIWVFFTIDVSITRFDTIASEMNHTTLVRLCNHCVWTPMLRRSCVLRFMLPLLGTVCAGPQDSCMVVSKFSKQAVTYLYNYVHIPNVPGTMECSCTKVRGCCLVRFSWSPTSTQ